MRPFLLQAALPLHPSTPPGITGYKTLPAWALCLGRNTSPMVKTSIPQLEIQIVPVRNLLPYQRALRKNAKAVGRMIASIREYGFKIPLLVSEQNVVIDGELRLKAAQKLKYTELPVIVCRDWSTEQVSAFRLMANRSATWAKWDLEAVAQEIAELSKTDFDLTLTGFDACEIEDLLSPVFDDRDTRVGSWDAEHDYQHTRRSLDLWKAPRLMRRLDQRDRGRAIVRVVGSRAHDHRPAVWSPIRPAVAGRSRSR